MRVWGFLADGHVAIDHASASPEIYGFEDPNPGYSQSLFNLIHVDHGNGNQNGYGGFGENDIGIGIDDGVFNFEGPVLPPPIEMEPEEATPNCHQQAKYSTTCLGLAFSFSIPTTDLARSHNTKEHPFRTPDSR
ncbi:hypothetical protein CMV_004524 [Castanea mollissima]|uniref:Uncharacterized protein n=1 Tax=Castanea mollissima TaxID=60419 RepID=A0A8J4RSM1_9ROSI|nr:hypothetical protein CMV_004524 [Castanea mollissima]